MLPPLSGSGPAPADPQPPGAEPLSGPAALPPRAAGLFPPPRAAFRKQGGGGGPPERSRKPRASPRLGQCLGKIRGEIGLIRGSEESRELHGLASRHQGQPLRAEYFVLLPLKPDEGWIEAPFGALPPGADLGELELEKRDFHIFVGARGTETGTECEIENRNVDSHETGDRPSA